MATWWEQLQYQSDLTPSENSIVEACVKDRLKLGNFIYIEIGVYFGGTFKRVLDLLKDTDSYCIGIDMFETYQEQDNNTHKGVVCNFDDLNNGLREQGYKNFELMLGNSLDILLKLPPIQNAVVFIDGNHKYKYCMLDFFASYMLVKQGYFIFHNSSTTWWPDNEYVQADGGPYLATNTILETFPVRLNGIYDRNTVIYKP